MIISKLFYLIRLFSLDIIAGALASLVFASSVMGIELPRTYYTVLALTVWLIYTADHLMDGAKTRGKSESETHNFFYNFKIPIILIFLMVLVFTYRLIMYRLDEKIIEFGIAPGIAVVAYLVLNRYYENAPKWFFIKEFWIALIYTLAIWGGSVIYAGDIVTTAQLLIIGSFGMIVLGNVLIYSIYDREADLKEGNRSLVRDFGLKAAVNAAIFFLSISILLALASYLFLGTGLIYIIPLLLISAVMLLIIRFPDFFTADKLYGIIADLVFLFFLLVLFR
jgi:4-hydroxybenzoate polyprenyltransferase